MFGGFRVAHSRFLAVAQQDALVGEADKLIQEGFVAGMVFAPAGGLNAGEIVAEVLHRFRRAVMLRGVDKAFGFFVEQAEGQDAGLRRIWREAEMAQDNVGMGGGEGMFHRVGAGVVHALGFEVVLHLLVAKVIGHRDGERQQGEGEQAFFHSPPVAQCGRLCQRGGGCMDEAYHQRSWRMELVDTNGIYVGLNESGQRLLLKYANRHGLIAGATGTGKTLSLQGLAEGFSRAGVPVFIADVKGDLSGLGAAGVGKAPLVARAKEIGFALNYAPCPVIFWDVLGKQGHPVRTTVSDMGPLMLARLLELNDTQEGVLNIAFAVADAEGLLLLDLDDLRAVLTHVSDNAADYSARYGNVSGVSVGAIMRALLVLEGQGGRQIFGEPALSISDLMRQAPGGQGGGEYPGGG